MNGISYWMIHICCIGRSLYLSFISSFILFMKYIKIGILFIIFCLVMEKVLLKLGGMLKCPNHMLPKEIIIDNFYARLSRHDKDLLCASSNGSFTNNMIDDKWDIIERI